MLLLAAAALGIGSVLARDYQTTLPLVIGTIMVAGVVIGAFMRTALRASAGA